MGALPNNGAPEDAVLHGGILGYADVGPDNGVDDFASGFDGAGFYGAISIGTISFCFIF